MRHIFSVVGTLAIIYIVPFALYSASTVFWQLEPPDGPAWQFLLSIFVSKAGTAIAFVAIYHFAAAGLGRRWLVYALIWWVGFAIGELGQAIGPDYSWQEALVGIISEAVYFPAAALVTDRLIGARAARGHVG